MSGDERLCELMEFNEDSSINSIYSVMSNIKRDMVGCDERDWERR